MMEVESREVAGRPVLDVRGDVDLSSSPKLRDAILEAVGPRSPSLAVNLAGVTYMDSSGLATLVEAFQTTRTHGGHLVLFGLTDRIRRIFELAHLDHVFRILADEQAALADLEGGEA